MFQTKRSPKVPLSTEKEWFIIVENRQEGPYSLSDLKKDPRFTPDTLIWKKGFKEWVAARKVAEIAGVFEDETSPPQSIQGLPPGKIRGTELGQESQVTLILQQDPYQIILWILIALLILIYTYYQFFEK